MGNVLSLAGADTAVDLGSSATLVHVCGRGTVLDEPSVVAVCRATGKLLAVGAEARDMVGRVPGDIEVVRPIRDGAIADLELATWMLRAFLRRAHGGSAVARPRLGVVVPGQVSRTQRGALEDVAYRAGGRRVHLVDQALAGALGAGLDVAEPVGGLLVGVGAGTTTVAVVSMGGIVVSRSAPVGGDTLDAAIRGMLRNDYGLIVGDRCAESVKIEIASAFPDCAPGDLAPVHGRGVADGVPQTVYVDAEDVREALTPALDSIVEVVLATLAQCPPELAGDLIDSGMALTGGGALLPGLDRLLEEHTGVKVHVPTDPRAAVVRGVARWLESSCEPTAA